MSVVRYATCWIEWSPVQAEVQLFIVYSAVERSFELANYQMFHSCKRNEIVTDTFVTIAEKPAAPARVSSIPFSISNSYGPYS